MKDGKGMLSPVPSIVLGWSATLVVTLYDAMAVGLSIVCRLNLLATHENYRYEPVGYT